MTTTCAVCKWDDLEYRYDKVVCRKCGTVSTFLPYEEEEDIHTLYSKVIKELEGFKDENRKLRIRNEMLERELEELEDNSYD